MHNINPTESPKDFYIMIAVPSTDSWDAQFGMALAALMFHAAQNKLAANVREQKIQFMNKRTSMLSQSRESFLTEAIENGCTHLLMLDSDMVFPADTLHKLIAHDRTFVGANYVRKCIPSLPVTASLEGRLTFTDPHSTGLEEVLHIGLGVALLRLEDVKELPMPRFPMEWSEELQCYSGEDVHFGKLLVEAGIPSYVDHDLSQEVKHIGTFAYDHTVVGEVVWGEPGDEDEEIIHAVGGE